MRLFKAEDVDAHILVLVANNAEDLIGCDQSDDVTIDRLQEQYLAAEGVLIATMDSPAVRKILRHHRRVQRELA